MRAADFIDMDVVSAVAFVLAPLDDESASFDQGFDALNARAATLVPLLNAFASGVMIGGLKTAADIKEAVLVYALDLQHEMDTREYTL